MNPQVSIVIRNWNELEDAIECLEYFGKVTYPHCEVTVVDKGSQGNRNKRVNVRG